MARASTVAIAVVSLLAAAYSGVDAFARVSEREVPQMAAGLPVIDGFALAERAENILQLGSKPAATPGAEAVLSLTPEQHREAVRLSRAGYRLEPLNHTAARNLGLVASADGDLPMARELMDLSNSITRRDLGTSTWRARDFARLGEVDEALGAFDQALRTSEVAQQTLLPGLLQYLQNDQLVEPVTELLEKDPPWQHEFWGTAPRYTASLKNIARVREAVAREGRVVREQYDRVLIAELAAHQQFAAAERLVGLVTSDDRPSGEALRNSEFDADTPFQPFGWELFFDSTLSTDISQSQGWFRISTFSDGGGRAARQLVALSADTYLLSVKVLEWDRLDEEVLEVELACAEGEAARVVPISIDRPNFSEPFRRQPDCRYYWLTVLARPQDDRQDNTVAIEAISLRPIRGSS